MAVNYMADATYHDPVYNPANLSPERGLKQLYKNNAVRPVSVAQVLTASGFTTVQIFAVSMGDTDTEARAFLNTDASLNPPPPGVPLWDAVDIQRRAHTEEVDMCRRTWECARTRSPTRRPQRLRARS